MSHKLPLQQFLHRAHQHPNKVYLNQPQGGQWTTYTWAQTEELARRVASGLRAQGLQPGDRVAIMGKNTAEWIIADLGILMAGMISVPIYSTAGTDTINHILSHSGSKLLFIGKLDDFAAVAESLQQQPTHIHTIGFNYCEIDTGASWDTWTSHQQPLEQVNLEQADDVMTIVYTSGSQGTPKGVTIKYSHAAAQGVAFVDAFAVLNEEGARMLSYLPLAHITERAIIELASLYGNLEIFFTESLKTFVADLQHARPTLFLSVPRLWSKFQTGVLANISDRNLQLLLKIPFVGKWLARKIRRQLGLDSCRIFASGSAPISPDILRWYLKLGMPISEGWGLTESLGPACINHPFEVADLGTIGKPLKCYDMKLSEQGEILIRGDGVFNEYYRSPEITAESFEDGWFKTGDKGEITATGAWKIIGRVKEQFKTSKGKYVSPVPIESLLGANPSIELSCVIGAGMKQPVALITLGEHVDTNAAETRDNLQQTLSQVNQQLESHQRLDYLLVAKEPWDIDNGLLTPTLKLKRDQIEQHYRHLLPSGVNGVILESEL